MGEEVLALIIAMLFSLGAINALIPILIILILLVAAAGLNRGYSLFNFFGLATLAGINPGGKASIAGKTGFGFQGAGFVGRAGVGLGGAANLGKRARVRINRVARRAVTAGAISGMVFGKGGEKKKLPKVRAVGRAVFMDKPSKTAQKIRNSKLGKFAGKVTANVKPRRLKSNEVSFAHTPITATARKIGRIKSAITHPKEGTIRYKIKNPETKTGKVLKVAAKAAAFSVVGTPFAGAGYLAYKAGNAAKSYRGPQQNPGSEAQKGFAAQHPVLAKLKSDASKMGKDLAFIATPAGFIYQGSRAAMRKTGEIREETREAVTKQRGPIEKVSNKDLSGRTREQGSMERRDTTAHGRAFDVADKKLRELGGIKGDKELTNQERRQIAKNLTPEQLREIRKDIKSELKKADRKVHAENTNRTIFTAIPRGIAGIVSAGKENSSYRKNGDTQISAARGIGRKIRENVIHAGESTESIATAKVARAIPDLIFIAKISKTEGRNALVSDEARIAEGKKPLTDRQKDILMAHQELDIQHTRKPDALQQHNDRIDKELRALGYDSTKAAQLGEGKTASAAQLGDKEAKKANQIEELISQKMAIAKNEHADPGTLGALAEHPDERVRVAVVQNKETPEDIIKKLANDPSEKVKGATLGNEKAPVEPLQKRINAEEKKLDAEQEKLAAEIEKEKRKELEKSINGLKSGIKDLNSKLIKNNNVDKDTLSKLTENEDKDTANAARDRLREKSDKPTS